jgi:hypothetical protein
VSALAHWLEDEGIATTLVALFRPHAERVAPPRALWVPFELGRPLGPPGDAAFQRRVLEDALRLLERDDGPSIIEDFPDDDPDGAGDPSWRCPVAVGADTLEAELEQVLPHYERARERYGRSTVGVSGVPLVSAAAYVAAYARDENAERPRGGMAPASLMRFCADDLKACYLEAADSGEGRPCSRQLSDWFWRETVAGKTLHAIFAQSAASADKQRQVIGVKSVVPGIYQ